MAARARLRDHAAAQRLRLRADDDAGLRAADDAGVVVRVRGVVLRCPGFDPERVPK